MRTNGKSILWVDGQKITTPLTIIGAGAVGSYLTSWLIGTGYPSHLITVYDADVIEEHNVENQIYPLSSVGKKKVEALHAYIAEKYDEYIEVRDEWFEEQDVTGFVVMSVDTISGRRNISQHLLSQNVTHIFDTRVGITHYETYNYDNSFEKYEWYEKTIPDEDELETNVSPCGTTTLALPFAAAVSALVASQVIHMAKIIDLGETLAPIRKQVYSNNI